MPGLFDPIRLGAIAAPNRIIMAPLTRGRATREHVPTPLMAEYYAQRPCCTDPPGGVRNRRGVGGSALT